MKTNLKQWGAGLALAFVMASCSPSAHIEKDDATDFTQYKTFAWIDKDSKGRSDKSKVNDLTEKKIRQAVNAELQKTAGWRETNRNPDVLLSYDVLVERSIRTQSDAVYSQPFSRVFYNPYSRRYINVFYPSRFMGYDSYDVPTREGTVTISMIDANSDKTVWQGWTTDEVDSRQLSTKEIQSSVKAIFKKFDVAKN